MKVRASAPWVIPVAMRQPGSVSTRTVDAKSSGRPSGYRKTFVPLNITKSGRAHAMALSSVSARKSNETRTARAFPRCTRQVSKSTLSQPSGFPSLSAAKFVTQREKFETSYAPGVHSGSDRSTGPSPEARRSMVTRMVLARARRASKATV